MADPWKFTTGYRVYAREEPHYLDLSVEPYLYASAGESYYSLGDHHDAYINPNAGASSSDGDSSVDSSSGS